MSSRLSLADVDFSDDEEFDDVVHQQFVNSSYGTYLSNQLVGHAEHPTKPDCGIFLKRVGCLNTDGHVLALQLQNEKSQEQIYQHPVFKSCHKLTCPACWRGAILREARSAEYRLVEAEKRLGLKCEHIVASIGPERYHYSAKDIRRLVLKGLKERGVIGGCLIPHAFRLNRNTGYWYFSPHVHAVAFIEGGYRCRSCRKQLCSQCDGFEGRTRKCFEHDGLIVKVAVDNKGRGVAGERRSIFQTLKYQLSHASVTTNRKRSVVVTWLGVCSYRKLKIKCVRKKGVCPYCSHRLVRLRYIGSKRLCIDRESPDFKPESHEDLRENGLIVWEEVAEAMHLGGWYE